MEKTPLEILQKYWKYDAFRPMQEEIINHVLEGKDTLALLPTGGGKSICFQVPALAKEGICIVVSPLIALMKDQVENLKKLGIAAEAIFSGMPYRKIDSLFDNCVYGNIKLLYLSPERLKTELAKERIAKMKVNLFAVDEAHCISQWGYDFRPPYMEIAEIRALHPEVPVIALTATATKEVVKDIKKRLNFNTKKVFQKSFRRDNLSYSVLHEENKEQKLLKILTAVKGSSVVYVRSRKQTKQIATLLRKNKISADFYHAGLEIADRNKKQKDWISGKIRVMVATNAFGMGIDKPNVRTVVHMHLPDNLESYFQEAGRAGRDQKKAYAVLLYSEEDKSKLEFSFSISFPEVREIRRVYKALGSYFQLAVGSGEGVSFDFDLVAFAKNFQLDLLSTLSCLKHLEKMGWIVMTDSVYIPAKIEVLVTREELYDFQIKNRKFEKVLKNLPRAYVGIFTDACPIDLFKFARFLKMPVDKLERQLKYLQDHGLLRYYPKKDNPQLVFIKERVEAKNLSIDEKLYNFLKERQKHRIAKAIEYCEEPTCRSNQLLAYFGEHSLTTCGVCDVCLGRKKEGLTHQQYERLSNKILRLLQKENLTKEEIVDSFSPKHKTQILLTIEYLTTEKIVEKEEEYYKIAAK